MLVTWWCSVATFLQVASCWSPFSVVHCSVGWVSPLVTLWGVQPGSSATRDAPVAAYTMLHLSTLKFAEGIKEAGYG